MPKLCYSNDSTRIHLASVSLGFYIIPWGVIAIFYYFLSRETRKQNNFLTNYIFVPTNKKYIIFNLKIYKTQV